MKPIPLEWSSFLAVGDEAKYLADAMESGWVSGGAYINRLEGELERAYHGTRAYAVSNGTSALQLAFQTLGVRPGDKVIVPNFCFQAAANVLIQLGAAPVFCDVDSLTWNQSAQTVSDAHTDGVVGVVVVHNYGRAAPSEKIVAWARSNGLWVIEDCAEAWFTELGGRYVGLFGDIATFSMHATKTISCGEGGVVILNRPELAERLTLLRSHGLNRSKVHYQHQLPGNNYRLSNLLAAVALAQFEKRDLIVSKQARRNSLYLSALEGSLALDLQHPAREANDLLWAVAVRLNTRLLRTSRDDVISELKARGIETRPGFYPASTFCYNRKYISGELPVSEGISKEIIVLPCAPTIGEADVERVVAELMRIVGGVSPMSTRCQWVDLKNSSEPGLAIGGFLQTLGDGLDRFRYFSKRPVSVVHQHEVSLMLDVDGTPVAYGHIEKEDDTYWLGIAVGESQKGRGVGKIIMSKMLGQAASLQLTDLHLKVDVDNAEARGLYERCGFRVLADKSTDRALHMVRTFS